MSAGAPGDVFEPRHTTHGFRYVRIEGHPDDAHAPTTYAASWCTPTCAAPAGSRAATPVNRAARGGRVELPRQRLRHPDRLPAPRARRLDRRLADLRADRRVPLRRRRLLHQVAARPGRRPVARRHAREHRARARRPRAGLADRAPERLGRLGRRGRARAVGALSGVRRRGGARRDLAGDGGLARPRRADGARAPPPGPGRRPAGAGAARAVPLGHRLPLGRVAGARRRARRLPGVHGRRQERRRDRVLLARRRG